MDAPQITPTDLAAFPVEAPLTIPDVGAPPTRLERFLRSPRQFWTATTLLLAPAGAFWLQALLHEIGRRDLAAKINDVLFDPGHSIVRDLMWPVVLPGLAIVLALARIRDSRPGLDRRATLALVIAGFGSLGLVFLYALLENINHLLRSG